MAKKKLKLVFANDVELPIHDLLSVMEPHIIAKYPDQAALDEALGVIGSGNLSTITVKKGTATALVFEDCSLEGYQVHYELDGTLTVHLYFLDHAHGLPEDEEDDDEEDDGDDET